MAKTNNIQQIEQDVIDIVNYLFVLDANGSISIMLDPIDHWQLFNEFKLQPVRKLSLVYTYYKNLRVSSIINDTWEEFFRTGEVEREADVQQIDKQDEAIDTEDFS